MRATTHASTNAANAFAGYTQPPTQRQVCGALGQLKPLWDRLLLELARDFKLKASEWNTSAPKRGWSLRLKQAERVIVYLTIEERSFHACFILGDSALTAAIANGLPASVMQLIRSAKKCAAGTGIRLNVRAAKDIAAVKSLVAAKLKG